MSIIKDLENDVKKLISEAGYNLDNFILQVSNRPDLGDYQINDAMTLASIYHENPRQIAEKVKEKLDSDPRFTNINIAGPGFINISLSDSFLIDSVNSIYNDIDSNIDKK